MSRVCTRRATTCTFASSAHMFAATRSARASWSASNWQSRFCTGSHPFRLYRRLFYEPLVCMLKEHPPFASRTVPLLADDELGLPAETGVLPIVLFRPVHKQHHISV